MALATHAAIAWPLLAQAQEQRPRRVGVLGVLADDDPEVRARVAAFEQAMSTLGWSNGRNVRIEYRWAGADAGRVRKYAAELAAFAPDVVLVSGSATVGPIQEAAPTIPIVFVQVVDPVGSGFVANLKRPGGNTTGFTQFEYNLAGKWLELLKEISPTVTRVAVLRDPRTGPGVGLYAVIQAVAPSLGVEVSPVNAVGAVEIERGIEAFAQIPNGGLIGTPGGTGLGSYRGLIIGLAERYRLPAIFPYRYHAASGGLLSYGPSTIDQFRRAAVYLDRILKGEKPGDMPVQAPTKYELVVNLKAAKALGLTVPATLLARADEVIE